MAIILPSGFNITNNEPVDARFSLASAAARYGLSAANIYEGLIVYQQDTNTLWVLKDTANYTNASGWEQVVYNASDNLSLIANGDTTASVSSGSTSFRVFDIDKNLLTLSDQGKLWVTGSVSASLVFGQIVSGAFSGSGDELFFTKLSTSQSSDTNLVIGNVYGNYTNRQTTIFKNGDVILSGSLTLQPLDVTPNVVSGGIFYSASGEFFVGIG
jgi:hypothetical protein